MTHASMFEPAAVTRDRPQTERIAGRWPIRRCIDENAAFIGVPAERALSVAGETGTDAILGHCKPCKPAVDRLAVIVRAADTARPEPALQAAEALAISSGLSATVTVGHAWCQAVQHEDRKKAPRR